MKSSWLSGTAALKVMLASHALQAANALNPANFNLMIVSQVANSFFIASYCKLQQVVGICIFLESSLRFQSWTYSLEPLHNSRRHSGLCTIKSEQEITKMERWRGGLNVPGRQFIGINNK
jgi:hypothetical protein